jgi:UDP-glucose 4-epimerase
MRIAVSGTTGLIGAAVARRLAKKHKVVSIGRRENAALFADFSDPKTLHNLDLAGFNAVVHCAGVVDEDFRNDPARAFRQATEGMDAFVTRARNCGVERFAYVSSAHVYGPLVGIIDERTCANPVSDYALAHFMSEQILRRATGSSFHGSAFRPCAVFGLPPVLSDFRRWTLAPFEFPKAIATSGQITLKSSGEQHRNFVGVDDIAGSVARWLHLAGTSHAMSVINPVGKESMSIWAFALLCKDAAEGLIAGKVSAVRLEPVGPCPLAPLDYGTIYPEYRGEQDLRQSIRALIEILISDKQD